MSETEEIWKLIPGYGGWYEVSSLGRVRSWHVRGSNYSKKLKIPRILKPGNNFGTHGINYLQVAFSKDGKLKTKRVHRLVLETFIGLSPKGYECAHLNGISTDNRVVNLKWVTPHENGLHRVLHGTTRAILNIQQVIEIRRLSSEGCTIKQIAEKYGRPKATISDIVRRRRWTHVK